MGSQVWSPTHVHKSQHGDKVSTFEHQETIVDLDYFMQEILGLVFIVGSSFLLNPTLNTRNIISLSMEGGWGQE